MFKEHAPLTASIIERNAAGNFFSFDIDAVVQATHGLALRFTNARLKTSIQKSDLITYWELVNIARKNGIPEGEALEFARGAWNRDETYFESPPVPGSLTVLKLFRDLGIPHIFVSSRPSEFLNITRKWFAKTFSWVDPENIIIGRPEGMSGGEFKTRIVRDHGVTVHIEDALEEASIIADETRAKVLLVPQPWNINEEFDNPKIMRLGPYSEWSGIWPVLRFLARENAHEFLSVAQY